MLGLRRWRIWTEESYSTSFDDVVDVAAAAAADGDGDDDDGDDGEARESWADLRRAMWKRRRRRCWQRRRRDSSTKGWRLKRILITDQTLQMNETLQVNRIVNKRFPRSLPLRPSAFDKSTF